MKLFKYDEFITESQLHFLLEANVNFTKEFISILGRVESPISNHLISTVGKEVDINQNYIDVNKDKTDTIFFKPDDKVGKTAVIKNTSGYISHISRILSKNPKSGIDSLSTDYPSEGKTVQIIKEWTLNELIELVIELVPEYEDNIKNIYDFSSLVLIQWIEDGKKYQTAILKPSLNTGPEAVRSSEVSLGRFVRALLTKSGIKFTDSEIEQFVYKYRSEIEKEKNALELRFKVVEGDEIKKYYHRSMYEVESGNLGNSCMRYDRCQSYLSIYTQNSQCKLLVFMSESNPDKIIGRAILWEMEPYELSTKVMDRIYTIKTADEQIFKEWAIKNKYWFKSNQDFSEFTSFEFHKEDGTVEKRQGEFSVQLDKKGDYSYYPYMDSFKYYSSYNGKLYNSSNFDYDYELTDTEGGNGSCSECGGNGRVECGNCDGDGTLECDECDGRGTVECDDCDGKGKEDCNVCDGEGEIECSTCDGNGHDDCDDCGGDGEIDGEECESCSGSGKQDCSDCDGEGKKQCYKCDGDGDIKCRNCDGDGSVECDNCDGSGERECYTCDGEGRHDCPEC
jgi:hypothetical protein